MKIVVYKASDTYLDGGSVDMISTNIGCFTKKVKLSDKIVEYYNYGTSDIVEDFLAIEDALIRYRRLQKISKKHNLLK